MWFVRSHGSVPDSVKARVNTAKEVIGWISATWTWKSGLRKEL